MALLFSQLATAHHNAAHLDHNTSFASYSNGTHTDHNKNHQKTVKHACPECLLSKSLNVTLAVAPVTPAYISFETLISGIENDTVHIAYLTKYTDARGPPPSLI